MSCTCVVGLQWGDEAKGKIVDILAEDHDFVVRYNGGNNAGHTIVWGNRTFKVSILPTGALKSHITSVIGNGVVVYPPQLLKELDQLSDAGIVVGKNLAISDHAHVIMPYHIAEDAANEGGTSGQIGTTGRGIGPCYQDKVGRSSAIRVGELLNAKHLRERLATIVPKKNRLLRALTNDAPDTPQFDANKVCDDYLGYAERMKPLVHDTAYLLHDGLKNKKKILFEAAQGSLLDIDHGTFPYVTSSSSLPSGIWSGTGVPAKHLSKIIGVVKAYTTRVGRGPFPTELNDGPDGIGERIRRIGREYGTVTGRPRRCGWFDAVAVRYTAMLAGADEITVMLCDVLSGLDELKLCVAYDLDGERITRFPSDAAALARCQPVYESIQGWKEDITSVRSAIDLPVQARRYVNRISELVGLPVALVSVGPDRLQTIALR